MLRSSKILLVIAQLGWLLIGMYALIKMNDHTTWSFGSILLIAIIASVGQLPIYRRLA